jgi:hypothetical protein
MSAINSPKIMCTFLTKQGLGPQCSKTAQHHLGDRHSCSIHHSKLLEYAAQVAKIGGDSAITSSKSTPYHQSIPVQAPISPNSAEATNGEQSNVVTQLNPIMQPSQPMQFIQPAQPTQLVQPMQVGQSMQVVQSMQSMQSVQSTQPTQVVSVKRTCNYILPHTGAQCRQTIKMTASTSVLRCHLHIDKDTPGAQRVSNVAPDKQCTQEYVNISCVKVKCGNRARDDKSNKCGNHSEISIVPDEFRCTGLVASKGNIRCTARAKNISDGIYPIDTTGQPIKLCGTHARSKRSPTCSPATSQQPALGQLIPAAVPSSVAIAPPQQTHLVLESGLEKSSSSDEIATDDECQQPEDDI